MPDDAAPMSHWLLGLLVYGLVMGVVVAGGLLFSLLVFAVAFVGGVVVAALLAALL